jgi:hypothetical protein
MRKHSNWITILAAIVLMAVAMAAPVSAHHGWSEYQDEQFEITGTLATPVSLAGPHGTAQIRDDEDLWMWCWPRRRAPRTQASPRTSPVGATVTASGHRHPTRRRAKSRRNASWNGKVFDVYPERN